MWLSKRAMHNINIINSRRLCQSSRASSCKPQTEAHIDVEERIRCSDLVPKRHQCHNGIKVCVHSPRNKKCVHRAQGSIPFEL